MTNIAVIRSLINFIVTSRGKIRKHGYHENERERRASPINNGDHVSLRLLKIMFHALMERFQLELF